MLLVPLTKLLPAPQLQRRVGSCVSIHDIDYIERYTLSVVCHLCARYAEPCQAVQSMQDPISCGITAKAISFTLRHNHTSVLQALVTAQARAKYRPSLT
jgi:hypothetical protein